MCSHKSGKKKETCPRDRVVNNQQPGSPSGWLRVPCTFWWRGLLVSQGRVGLSPVTLANHQACQKPSRQEPAWAHSDWELPWSLRPQPQLRFKPTSSPASSVFLSSKRPPPGRPGAATGSSGKVWQTKWPVRLGNELSGAAVHPLVTPIPSHLPSLSLLLSLVLFSSFLVPTLPCWKELTFPKPKLSLWEQTGLSFRLSQRKKCSLLLLWWPSCLWACSGWHSPGDIECAHGQAHTPHEVYNQDWKTPRLYKGHLLPHFQLKQKRPATDWRGQPMERETKTWTWPPQGQYATFTTLLPKPDKNQFFFHDCLF